VTPAGDRPAGAGRSEGTPEGTVPVPGAEVAEAIARAGRINALLGIGIHGDADGLPAQLLCHDPSARAARALVDAVGDRLGAPERRVAASMVVLGYAARLVGPAMALLLRDGMLLDLRPSQVRYSYRPDRGFRLSTPQPAGWAGAPATVARHWCRQVIDGHLSAVVEAVRVVTPVATGLLWGNVASGLVGAVRTVAQHSAVPAERCAAQALELLRHGPLAGSGTLTVVAGRIRFTRRSCCLYYRLDGGGLCADCPLPSGGRPPPPRR
jgi:ferric iron reductase protein FhuF